MFFKYRTKWSHGVSEWKIIERSNENILRKYFQENQDYNYSEHFRGYEWKKLNNISERYLKKMIENNTKRIKYLQEENIRLKKIKTVEEKKICSTCARGPKKHCQKWKKSYILEKCINYSLWKEMISIDI